MMTSDPAPYPGSNLRADEVLRLAESFERAAVALFDGKAPDGPLRLCALHAIELYLNAFLLSHGEPPGAIRARQHDLAARAEAAKTAGLILRRKTEQHLLQATARREYLAARYAADAERSDRTRLTASLSEVAAKVRRHLAASPSGAAA